MAIEREIKFRAKILQDDKVELLTFELGDVNNWFAEDDVFYIDGIPCEIKSIQRYIGQKDCDGKDIYEGDVVEWKLSPEYPSYGTAKMAVEWQNDNQCFVPHINNTSKIIGNIYENPELLK